MRYSKLLGKTIKNVPTDLTATSHKLLHQGGFIRQVAAGRYAFLPLGFRVWNKIYNIIEQEMNAIGSQHISTPIFQPIEIWKATNRDKAFGGEMHIVEDHHGSTFALSATAEGLMTEMVRDTQPSYRDLPIYAHQFITKFRDEKRPRGGLLRVREFMMKDAYSFDKTEEEALKTYQIFTQAYLNIAKKLNLTVYPVLADSGAIGGEYNHEFIIQNPTGEAYAVLCDSCNYAAQLERAQSEFETYTQDKALKQVQEYWDETVVNCELLAQKMKIDIKETTKTIMFNIDGQFVAVMIRGDYNINETKLKKHFNAHNVELASDKHILELTGAKVGFVGPVNLPKEVTLIADLTCQNRTNFEAGGNKTGLHLYNLNFERDFKTPEFVDLREVLPGDTCQNCKKGKLKIVKGIEWGHTFKLDQFYSAPHKGTFVDQDGTSKTFWMGSYGIGLGRTLASIVEVHHDENGIIWPQSVAPYQVHLVGLNLEDSDVLSFANEVYDKLTQSGVEVLFDDRDYVSAGQKFGDADLIGCPLRVVVSKKNGNMVEVKKRNQEESMVVKVGELFRLI